MLRFTSSRSERRLLRVMRVMWHCKCIIANVGESIFDSPTFYDLFRVFSRRKSVSAMLYLVANQGERQENRK